MSTPLITLTLAYCAGLLFGHGFLHFPYAILLFLTLLVVVFVVLILRRRLSLLRFSYFVLPCAAGFAAYIYSAAWVPQDHYTRRFPAGIAVYELTGTIVSTIDRDPERTGFSLALSTIDGSPVSGLVKATLRAESPALGYGDTIRVPGRLIEPVGFNNPGGFDYPAFLARSGIRHTVTIKHADAIEIVRRGSGLFRMIQDQRERIRQAFLAGTSGDGSAILQAMVLGEEGFLTNEMRDGYLSAGVTHIISISGSHLAMVAALCFSLIKGLLRLIPETRYHEITLHVDPKKIAIVFTLPLVIFYTALAGGQVATVRSLVLIVAGLTALLLDRDHGLLQSLALAALIILAASPQAIFDISLQLSFTSVLVIAFIIDVRKEFGFEARSVLQRTAGNIALLVVLSLAVSLATGPLVAHYFNQISLVGIVANMFVVPLAGMVVVPLGLFSGILSLFTHSLPLESLNQLVADGFNALVFFFARFPFAQIHLPAPGVLWVIASVFFLIALFGFLRAGLLSQFKPFEFSARRRPLLIACMVLSGAILIAPALPGLGSERAVRIRFPDVGQGDSALVTLPSGKTILIDGGGARGSRFDMGRRVLAPYLWTQGIRKLDLVILSHPHPDHMEGLIYLLQTFDVGEVWESGQDNDLPGHSEFSKTIENRHILLKRVSADDPPAVLGEAELSVLHPSRDYRIQSNKAYADENNRSLAVRIKSGGRSFLFTGDIGTAAEMTLLRRGEDLKCDLLKIPTTEAEAQAPLLL